MFLYVLVFALAMQIKLLMLFFLSFSEHTSDAGNSSSKNQNTTPDVEIDSSSSDDDIDDENQPNIYAPLSYGRSTRTTQRTTSPPPAPTRFLDLTNNYNAKPLPHRARFLMTGSQGMGQSAHLAPAVLYAMEHLKVYVLDLPSLFGVSARVPEEACSQVCVVYIPEALADFVAIEKLMH